jgi:hypothetical protein
LYTRFESKGKVRNAMQYNTHLITYMQQIDNEKQHNNKKTSLTCTAMYNPGTLNDSNIISIEKNYKEIISLVVPILNRPVYCTQSHKKY